MKTRRGRPPHPLRRTNWIAEYAFIENRRIVTANVSKPTKGDTDRRYGRQQYHEQDAAYGARSWPVANKIARHCGKYHRPCSKSNEGYRIEADLLVLDSQVRQQRIQLGRPPPHAGSKNQTHNTRYKKQLRRVRRKGGANEDPEPFLPRFWDHAPHYALIINY